MTTARQITANQQNAKLSTGPRTAEGKAIASRNALKHGLLATSALLPGENADVFNAFKEGMVEDFQPVGVVETVLVDRIVSLAWRLQRLASVETGMFQYNFHDRVARRAEREAESLVVEEERWLRDELSEKEVLVITDKEAHANAKREQEWSEHQRDRGVGKAASAFLGDVGDGFAKLQRYETGLDRSFYKALRELQRLQAARLGADLKKDRIMQIVAIAIKQAGQDR